MVVNDWKGVLEGGGLERFQQNVLFTGDEAWFVFSRLELLYGLR
jgi:hypothetical protein